METFLIANNSVYLIGDYQMLQPIHGPTEFVQFETSANKTYLYNQYGKKTLLDVHSFKDLPSWTLQSDYTGGKHPLSNKQIRFSNNEGHTYHVSSNGELKSRSLQPYTSYFLVNYTTWRDLTWVKIKYTLRQQEYIIRVIEDAKDDNCKQTRKIPAHWGKEPLLQTGVIVTLPDGYGCGSSTKKQWILDKQMEDKKRRKRPPSPPPQQSVPQVRKDAPVRVMPQMREPPRVEQVPQPSQLRNVPQMRQPPEKPQPPQMRKPVLSPQPPNVPPIRQLPQIPPPPQTPQVQVQKQVRTPIYQKVPTVSLKAGAEPKRMAEPGVVRRRAAQESDNQDRGPPVGVIVGVCIFVLFFLIMLAIAFSYYKMK